LTDNIVIRAENLTKTYRLYNSNLERLKESLHPLRRKYHYEFDALHDVSFEIKKGETVGIIGKNGSGKSTLLKLISGVLTPTSGCVTVNGRVSALLELGSGFNPELTGIENVYFNGMLMGYRREEMEARLDDILAFADIGEFVHQPVKSYSSGMFVRLAFAVATIIEPDVLIVDEALSVGDLFFQQKCYGRLKELKDNGVTILFVTHSMGDIVQYCQQSLLLNNNRLEYKGLSAETVKRYLLLQQKERLAVFVKNVAQKNTKQEVLQYDGESFFWPDASQLSDLSTVDAVSSGIAMCTGVAICNDTGAGSKLFAHGSTASIFCEFELFDDIEVPIGGFIIKNEQNVMVHGKNSLQYDNLLLPSSVRSGQKVRFRFDVKLDIAPGEYTIDVGLATLHTNDFAERINSPSAYVQAKTLRLCNLSTAERFAIISLPIFDQGYDSLHSGVCNLKGASKVNLISSEAKLPNSHSDVDNMPTIFHVTHWKAGSQWINKILREAVPDLYVEPKVGVAHFMRDPIEQGMVYPTVYVTKNQFDSVPLPPSWKRFVVIRDLRDTLISGYFSLKVSHAIISNGLSSFREKLLALDIEDGLLYLLNEWLNLSAAIQESWLDSGEEIIKYEDLLSGDTEILVKTLVVKCHLPVSSEYLKEVIINNRFEKLTGGRERGVEEVSAHERKGISGDWQKYFTPKIKEAFKSQYNGLLVKAGYEKDSEW